MSALDLSVAIVCKNNQATIGRTLDSVRGLAGEIVAVDSGSTDATMDLLAGAGARVISSPWLGHVRTKQMALEACTRAWVLCLDSDESLLPALQDSLRDTLARDGGGAGAPQGYLVNRKVFYQGRPLHHAWQPEWRLRLVRRGRASWGGVDPHDQLRLHDGAGAPGRLAGDLRHDSFATFEEQLRKQVGYARLMADQLVAQGQRGSYWRLATSAPAAMLKQLIIKGAWRDGWPGWLAAGATAANALCKHALIIERARMDRQEP